MLEDILEPESQTFIYKEKDYVIAPMNMALTMKVLKTIPVTDVFTSPTTAFMNLLTVDSDKLTQAVIDASQMKKDVVMAMLPHDFMKLLKVVFEVNKPSFLLAWEMIAGVLQTPKETLTGEELSKPSLVKATA